MNALPSVNVVAVHRNVDRTVKGAGIAELLYQISESTGDLNAAPWNPDQRHAVEKRIAFDDLVRNPLENAIYSGSVENETGGWRRWMGLHGSFANSQDRVKGMSG